MSRDSSLLKWKDTERFLIQVDGKHTSSPNDHVTLRLMMYAILRTYKSLKASVNIADAVLFCDWVNRHLQRVFEEAVKYHNVKVATMIQSFFQTHQHFGVCQPFEVEEVETYQQNLPWHPRETNLMDIKCYDIDSLCRCINLLKSGNLDDSSKKCDKFHILNVLIHKLEAACSIRHLPVMKLITDYCTQQETGFCLGNFVVRCENQTLTDYYENDKNDGDIGLGMRLHELDLSKVKTKERIRLLR